MDDQAWLEALAAAPDDDAHRLVYADWLDDAGQGAKAEVLRLAVRLRGAAERIGVVAQAVDEAWLDQAFGGDDGLELRAFTGDPNQLALALRALTSIPPEDTTAWLPHLPRVVFRGNRRDLAEAEAQLGSLGGCTLARVPSGDCAALADLIGWGELVLVHFPPEAKIQVIVEIRRATGFGLKEAKALSDRPLPVVVMAGRPADLYRAKLRFDGCARVRIGPARPARVALR